MIRTVLMAAASAMVLGLAACDENGRARVDAPEPAPLAELTAEAADLPFAEPAPVEVYAPDQGYRWAERAYGLQRAVHDTPPDYGFAYGDVEPMVWETQDDWDLYAEPWDGGYRYYYYEPGAAYPYFVRDRDYGYAYDGAGVLIALFGADGRYLPRETVYRYAPTAGRYYVRGRDLRNAGLQARRTRVSEQVWRARAPRVQSGADRWLQAAREERSWRAWRERDHDRELARFEPETRRRAAVQQAWRERQGRLTPVERDDAAAQQRRMEAQVERRDRVDDRDGARRDAAQAVRQQQAQDRREQQAAGERTRRVQQAEQQRRTQAEADRRTRSEQHRLAQTEQKRQQQAAEQRRQEQAQQQARAEQRRQAQAEQTRQQQQAERRQQQDAAREQARAKQQGVAQQAQAEQRRRQQDAAREQARANQQGVAQQAQAEQRRRQQAAQQQQRQQAQAEQQRQQQAAQQLQRQKAQAAERRQQQAAQREARQVERAQARAAEAQGQPAAARDRDGGKDRRGPDGKD